MFDGQATERSRGPVRGDLPARLGSSQQPSQGADRPLRFDRPTGGGAAAGSRAAGDARGHAGAVRQRVRATTDVSRPGRP